MSEVLKRPRGRDVRKMDKPYTGREVIHTCSNGWTIERVIEDEFHMEAFFMGHCLSPTSCGVDTDQVFSLREPDGTPHATIVMEPVLCGFLQSWEAVGRCNMPPKAKYTALIKECDLFASLP